MPTDGRKMKNKDKLKLLIYPDRAFYKEVMLIAVPVALQGLITMGVNLVDTVMIGELGERQLSAASLATQYVNIFHSLCMGLSMGASVLASRFWGMKEYASLKRTITVMFRFCLVLAVFFMCSTAFAPEAIMRMYTAESDVAAYGAEYLKYCVWSYLFYGLSLTSTIIMRSIHKVRIPLLVSLAAFFLNIGGNYMFMFGRLGFPAMGIAGAALSTWIVRVFECAVICGYLLLAEDVLRYRPKDLFMKAGDILPEYIKIGIPVFMSDMILALGTNAVMMVIGHLGAAFVAANAITAVVERISNILIAGVSQGSAVVTGNTLGRGEAENAERQGWAFLGIGLALGLLAGLVMLLLADPIIGLYHLTEETAAITRQLLYAMSLMVVFTAMNHILTKGALRGGGDTKALLVADNIFLWVVSIPLGILAGFVFPASAFWIYICIKMDNPLKTIWCVMRLKSKKWIKKIEAV